MSFKRILVAINHSLSVSVVFNHALNLAQKEQANLMILYCLTDVSGLEPPRESGSTFEFYPANAGFSQSLCNETLQLQTQQAEAWLQEYRQKAGALDIPTEHQHHVGDPGSTICQIAQQWGADLIILGRHDKSAISEFFTGSVSNHVIHHASCSVLAVKAQESKSTLVSMTP